MSKARIFVLSGLVFGILFLRLGTCHDTLSHYYLKGDYLKQLGARASLAIFAPSFLIGGTFSASLSDILRYGRVRFTATAMFAGFLGGSLWHFCLHLFYEDYQGAHLLQDLADTPATAILILTSPMSAWSGHNVMGALAAFLCTIAAWFLYPALRIHFGYGLCPPSCE